MPSSTNTQFALAVHAMTLLAAEGPGSLNSEEIGASAQASPVHVRRVLARLRCAGLVSSRPGVGGGWRLEAEPGETTLAAVRQAIHDDGHVLSLHGAHPDCEVGQGVQRVLLDLDQRAAAAVEAELAATTLSDVLAGARAGRVPEPAR